MEYMKHLLNKEKVKLGEFEPFAQLFEMMSNQQELKTIGKKAVFTLKSLKGEVSLVHFFDNKHNLIGFLGNKETVESHLLEKRVLKKVKDTKKPYFDFLSDSKEPGFYAVLPILSKDEFLGALIVHDEQEIGCWKEIHMLLHLMAVAFKYYKYIEVTKNVNIQDAVTELFNYRHFQDQMDLEIEKAVRYRIPLSLVLFDIKDFKQINDKLGSAAGDDVLKQVGAWIKGQARKIDMPARLDADTFGVLMSNTGIGGAEALCNRILLKAKNHSLEAGGKSFKVKLKTSIAAFQADYSKEEFFENAMLGLQ